MKILIFAGDEHIKRHSADDERAGGNLLEVSFDTEHVERIIDQADDERADNDIWNFALAAEETGAADDRRRDGKGFMARAGHRFGRAETGDHDDAADARADAGDDVNQQGMQADVDAGKPGGFLVAAERVEVAAHFAFWW